MISLRPWTLLPLAGLAAVASGCVSIQSTSTAQPQSMGPVRLTVTACASESAGCPSGNAPSLYRALVDADSDLTFPGQPLVALRLPDGAVPPHAFSARAGGESISFTRSASYESALQQFEPAPAGERWWGWLGGQISYGRRTTQAFTFTLEVPLPRPADGGPLASPLHWRPVVGARAVDVANGLPATRTVDCGTSQEDFYEGYSEKRTLDLTTVCAGAPSAEATRGYLDAPLTDFGLTGTTVTAPAGATTTALFLATRSGAADPATSFSLAVAGGPPNASVTIDRTSASLRDAVTPVQATVAVAAGTPAGSYPLTLTATAPGKPTRTATATVVVPAPPVTPAPPGGGGDVPAPRTPDAPRPHAKDTTKPILSATLKPARVRAGARVTVAIKLSERATLTTKLGRRRPLRRAARAGRSRFTLATRGLRAGRHTVTFVATDAAGNRSKPVRGTLTIRR